MGTREDTEFMRQALALAEQAAAVGEVPVGAVLVLDNKIIGRGHNSNLTKNDPTAHAEIVALRHAAQYLGVSRLPESTLYVTIEPCSMCAGALVQARVATLVYGAREPRSGAVVSAFELLMSDKHNHRVTIKEGVLAEPCANLMSAFFKTRRSR